VSPPLRSVVLDYDGTLTDVDAGAVAFRARFDAAIAALIGRPEAEVSPAFREVEAMIDAAPAQFGWSYRGVVVAPACADPYIRATCAAHFVFDRFGFLAGDEPTRADRIYDIYRDSYRAAVTVFRDDARAVLEALLARLPAVHVVTNAAPEIVADRIATLGVVGAERLRVVGDARKFVVEPPAIEVEAIARVPETLTVPGLTRPVLVRRGRYFDALVAISRETSVRPEEMLVCGDIFELDLALPFAMGAQVHLLLRATTPEYERRFVEDTPRGGHGTALGSVLERLDRS
jgi:phosphoglycolate phosphatase-like HAD superfamily hydrolase